MDSRAHPEQLQGLAPMVGVASHIDHDSASEDQDVVLSRSNLDTVSIRPREPLFGDLRDLDAVARDFVLMIHEVALGLQIIGARDIDSESAFEEREQLLGN